MSRALTSGEIQLAKKVFKGSIDYTRVKVHDEKYVFFQPDNSGMTPNGEIHVQGIYKADYSVATQSLQSFFIHEMTHVWQYQRGILTLGVIGSAIFEIIGQAGDYDAAYPYVLNFIVGGANRATRKSQRPGSSSIPSATRFAR